MTALQPDTSLPVEAHGSVRLEGPGGRSLDLLADGATLRLDVAGWSDLRAIMPGTLRTRAQAVRVLSKLLTTYDLLLSLESGKQPVFQLGRNVRPSWLARLLGLAPARIPLSAIRLLFKR